ncbi:hypothetical protein chiPu_0001541 [Chiloscyllium punctatum]|uniref:Uncharacterized protein n=1 Tax=Chiloscyllium punctatum TaxID=137246 RepID=A0A401RYH9_CHIPU|nr:hypothetical protein [Chiloscyllium punctatum]
MRERASSFLERRGESRPISGVMGERASRFPADSRSDGGESEPFPCEEGENELIPGETGRERADSQSDRGGTGRIPKEMGEESYPIPGEMGEKAGSFLERRGREQADFRIDGGERGLIRGVTGERVSRFPV